MRLTIGYIAGALTVLLAFTHGPRVTGWLLRVPGDIDYRRRQ